MTAPFRELYNGIAVIIDDDINDRRANVNCIIKQIDSRKMPRLLYSELPSDETIKHFHSLSFLVLDWQLNANQLKEDDVRLPGSISEENNRQNAEFIRKILNCTYCPIFIFTNGVVNDVVDALKVEGLYSDECKTNILIRSKSDIISKGKMFKEIDNWIKKNPSVYVLKEWSKEYTKASAKVFREMSEINPSWPKIMWKTFHDDGLNKSHEMGELISRNLLGRMIPFEFSDSILRNRENFTNKEILNVLRGERYLPSDAFPSDTIHPGDVFKLKGDCYINIRASCDLISRNNSGNSAVDLYLLKGSKIKPENLSKRYNPMYGNFADRENAMIIYPICDNLAIEFFFTKIYIETWSELKDKRIGRVLPPFINRLQQRYAYHLHRYGMPRFPKSAIPKKSKA